jgi:hypothetical protein
MSAGDEEVEMVVRDVLDLAIEAFLAGAVDVVPDHEAEGAENEPAEERGEHHDLQAEAVPEPHARSAIR